MLLIVTYGGFMKNKVNLFFYSMLVLNTFYAFAKKQTMTDFGNLTHTQIAALEKPTTLDELKTIVLTAQKPLSIAGARYSQGGQICSPGGTVIDMKKLNAIVVFNLEHKTITVQTGATWREVQEYIDPYNLSVSVMQSYSDFTVGGSLSVNAHGRYISYGPIISTVKNITILLADGTLKTASRSENSDLFYAAIGGYGALGIIVTATLQLTGNQKIERSVCQIALSDYTDYFAKFIKPDPCVILHNANLYLADCKNVTCTTWRATTNPLTHQERLYPKIIYNPKSHLMMNLGKRFPIVQKLRPFIDTKMMNQACVIWRNYEAGLTVNELFYPKWLSVSLLQEYFIPTTRIEDFLKVLSATLKKENVNVLNISLRHVTANSESILSWSDKESFAVVLFYDQRQWGTAPETAEKWVRTLIDAALALGGTYYLPYRLSGTKKQFKAAYPRADQFWKIKRKYDPQNIFSNMLLEKYFK